MLPKNLTQIPSKSKVPLSGTFENVLSENYTQS